MKLNSFKKIAPADVSVGSIPFRGQGTLDIFPLTSNDIFWLMTRSPEIAAVWQSSASEEEKGFAMLAAIGKAGPDVLNRLLIAGTRITETELEEADLSLEEQVEIICAVLELGVPEGVLGKLRAAFQTASAKVRG